MGCIQVSPVITRTLGDINKELLSYAQDYKRRMYLACCAIRILGRDPDAELMEQLEKIHDESTHNYVRGAVASARSAFDSKRHLSSLKEPRQKIGYILRDFDCDWNIITEGSRESDNKKKPRSVYAQRQLLRLSELHPVVVARAVHDLEYGSELDPEYNRSYREYIASRFLSNEAKSEFRKLEQNQRE